MSKLKTNKLKRVADATKALNKELDLQSLFGL
jgi:hypothetical protein